MGQPLLSSWIGLLALPALWKSLWRNGLKVDGIAAESLTQESLSDRLIRRG